MATDIQKAYEEVKLCLVNNKHNLSTESLQYCLEALRIVGEQEHKGFSNYPTWYVASWINNNKDLKKEYTALVDEMWSAGENNDSVIGVLSQSIEANFSTECMKYQLQTEGTVWASLLNHIDKDLINYYEIAKNFINN